MLLKTVIFSEHYIALVGGVIYVFTPSVVLEFVAARAGGAINRVRQVTNVEYYYIRTPKRIRLSNRYYKFIRPKK